MLKKIGSLSLKRRFILVITLAVGFAVFTCAAFLAIFDSVAAARSIRSELASEAKILGANSAASLAFLDPKSAREVLEAEAMNPRTSVAEIFDANGNRFAGYIRKGSSARAPKSLGEANARIRGAGFGTVQEIDSKGERMGWIYLEGGDEEFSQRTGAFLLAVVCLVVAATGMAILAAFRLQRLIFEPINALSIAMDKISRQKDYSVRMEPGAGDEVGDLVATFNEMLEEVDIRDQQLENRVAERTRALSDEIVGRELAQHALQEALIQAQAASLAKSEFLANMSHEIRTPMNGVLGMTEILMSEDLRDRQAEYVQVIHSSAQSLLSIINDILDFSKIEAGMLTLCSEPFSLQSLVDEVGRAFGPSANRDGLDLVCWCAPDLPAQVEGDRDRLKQVLVNLVGNAVKFTEAGGVTLTVTRASIAEVDDGVRLEVSDTGVGISRDHQELVFDSFTQADGRLNRKKGGTGLGLTICKQLVDLMDGSLQLSSTVGLGSTFTVTVSLKQLQPAKRMSALEGQRFLVVTENAKLSDRIETTLAYHGAMVDRETSGLGAFNRLVTERYDYLLCERPVAGFQPTELREFIDKGLKVYKFSALELKPPAAEIAALGIEEWLTKPLNVDRLVDSLRVSTVRAKRSALPEPASNPPPKYTPTVLLVEDNDVNSMVATKLLQRLGCEVVRASSGLDALEKVGSTEFDLVLMDVQMPGLDGLETTERIRKSGDPRIRGLTIVAMTANAMTGDREICLGAGMDDYVTKPINGKVLAETLNKWVLEPSALAA